MTGCRLRETVEQKKKKRGQRHTLESMLGGTNLVPVKKKKKHVYARARCCVENLLSFHQWRRRAAVAHTWAGGICPQKKKKDDLWPGI